MAMARYNPRAKPASRVTRDEKEYRNTDGPGGSTVNYGPQQGANQREQWAADMAEFGPSPWFSGGAQMPWNGPAGQQRGQRTPFFTPDPADERNAGYWRNESTPEQDAIRAQAGAASDAARNAAYENDPRMREAIANGDMRGYLAARQRLGQAAQQQRFVDQGGTPETWVNRNNTAWPVPGSPTGNYQYGPGRPGPTPPGVAPVPAAATPANNPMFTGYQPAASKSGMGQGVNYGGASTGQGGLGGAVPQDMMARLGGLITNRMGYDSLAPAAGLSSDAMRKLAMGMPAHLAGIPQGAVPAAGRAAWDAPMTMGRGFPGGFTPTNPGGPGGRPTTGPVEPIPFPGGVGGGVSRDYLSSLASMNQMSPAMSGFQGMNARMMDPGMMMFGYRPY